MNDIQNLTTNLKFNSDMMQEKSQESSYVISTIYDLLFQFNWIVLQDLLFRLIKYQRSKIPSINMIDRRMW